MIRFNRAICAVTAAVTAMTLCSCYASPVNVNEGAANNTITGEQEEKPEEADLTDPGVSENSADIISDNSIVSEDAVPEEPVNEYADKHVKLSLLDSGYDVFTPSVACLPDYRYGPSIMLNDDGSIDAWFSAPGDGSKEYDWVTWRHSDDGGATWSSEEVAISPSHDSPDTLSTCDPDVFYYGGYYYIGYTSTINKKGKGICNSVFLARSKTPDGPYEKWNGSGWGGDPVPIIYFDGLEIGWGSGEPSFVVVDDVLYIYNTKDSYSGVPARIRITEVRTADLTQENWPANLSLRGISGIRTDTGEESEYQYRDSDSWDVAYLEESKKFIAVATNRRFKYNSCILYFESNDGIHFTRVSELNTNVVARCHNCGIMADGQGHIKEGDPMMIGYAYAGSAGSRWGVWATRFAPLNIDYTDEPDRTDESASNLKIPLSYRSGTQDAAPMMLVTDQLTYSKYEGTGAFNINYYVQDNYKRRHAVNRADINIVSYDDEILSVGEDNWISPRKAGTSRVIVEYNGLWREVYLRVLSNGDKENGDIAEYYPITDHYELSVIQPYIIKLRPLAVMKNGSMHELTGHELKKYGVTFETDDPNICEIRQDGSMIPLAVGDTTVRYTAEDGRGVSVRVHVVEVW